MAFDWTVLIGAGKIFIWGILILLVIGIATGVSIWQYKRKKWNLTVTIRLPRENSKSILSDIAKGYWDAAQGSIIIKRSGRKPVGSRPIDPKKWVQGSSVISVIQVGPEDYIICLEDSYKVVTGEDGKQYAILNIISDVGKRKTWGNYFERTAKKAFTLRGWLEQHQFAVVLAVLMFTMFLGFSILWSRIPKVCG